MTILYACVRRHSLSHKHSHTIIIIINFNCILFLPPCITHSQMGQFWKALTNMQTCYHKKKLQYNVFCLLGLVWKHHLSAPCLHWCSDAVWFERHSREINKKAARQWDTNALVCIVLLLPHSVFSLSKKHVWLMLNRELCENPIWLFVQPPRACSHSHECKIFTHSESRGQPKAELYKVNRGWQFTPSQRLDGTGKVKQIFTKVHTNIFRITATHSNTHKHKAVLSSGRH